jgi:FtsH-binding integral membrane protein
MASTLRFLRKFKPGVRKNWLQFTSGLIWLGVGLMLISFASRWLKPVAFHTMILLVLAGCLLATGIYFFGFSKLAKKNIKRIRNLEGEKICLFAFQGWTSYPLVAFMISLGIYLRAYSPFPKPLLAILYLGIGGGLSLASLLYFAQIARVFQPQNAEV